MKSTGAQDVADLFGSFGIPTSRSDVYNELFVIKSPIIMENVVKELKLNVSYSKEGLLRNSTLYGAEVPFDVEFIDGGEYGKSFKIDLAADTHRIRDFYYHDGNEFVEDDSSIDFNPEKIDTISTPLGRVVITPNANFVAEKPLDMTIDVRYVSIYTAVEQLISSIVSSQPEEHASIIELSIEDTSTERANDILDTLIKCYNQKWVDDRNEISRATSDFIDERLSVIESELGNVDDDISEFKAKNLIPDVQAVSGIYLSRSEKNQDGLLELTTQRQMAQYIKDYLGNPNYATSVLPVNTGVGSPALEANIAEYNKSMLAYKSLLGNSSKNNPIVEDMGKSIEESRKAILEAMDNLIVGLDTQIASLNRSTKQTNSKLSGAPGQTKYLLSVERQQKVKESLYLYLLQKREENEIGQVFTPSNVRIISYARGSNNPIAPKRINIIFISLALGLILPFGIIFVYESMNDTVRYRSDLDMLTTPYLGDIPECGKNRHRWERILGIGKNDKQTGYVVGQGKTDAINEAFRIVRSNVSYMLKSKCPGNDCKVIMMTSAIPHSGKTFVTQNLAAAFAVKGNKVLMIDMDLRRHALSKEFREATHRGVSNLLLSGDDPGKYIISGVKGFDTLSLLGSGPVPPNPTELLENGNFNKIIDELKAIYDLIIIDCPPLSLVSDTQSIAMMVDMTVFIIRIGNLSRDYVPEVERIYRSGKYSNMSILLNGVSYKQGGGYNYGYGYGYGYRSKG